MREMKDSGVAWIGEIPEEWEILNLKTVAYIQTGSTPAKSEQNIYYSNEDGIPWIKAENLGSFSSISKTKEYLTKEGELEGRIFPENTVFICCIASVGKVGYSQIKCSCNQQINGLVFNLNMFWKYGFYLSVSQEELYSVYASGNVMKIINSERQSRLLCTVPPLNEQQTIATYLDQKCTQIDALIANQQKQIEKLKAYKQSLITETVTKGLNPDVPMKDSGVEWIGEIPEGWDILQLSSVVTERKHKNIGMIETNLLSLSYGNVIRKNINTTDGLLPESFEGYNIIEAGDIVLRLTDLQNDHKSLRSGLCTERGIITSAYVTLANRGGTLISEYLHYLLHTFDIYKGFYGMGAGVRQGLNFDGIKKILLTRPKIEEQQAIVSYLDQKCTQIDSLIAIKQRKIEKLQQYKKSVIYEYVTGKKEVK